MERLSTSPVPLVAAVNDLSGFGRCSLTVAIPVLSAMGLQVCPLPTAILSNHTGYESGTFMDFTPHMETYAAEWEKRNLEFRAIYTGFLGNLKQVKTISAFIRRFRRPDTMVLVDPVMGDNGTIYATYTAEMCRAMRDLTVMGTVATPNLTEACLLADWDYRALTAEKNPERLFAQLFTIGDRIAWTGPSQVVITGVRPGDGAIHNIVVDRERDEHFVVRVPMVEKNFAGTGDVFASVLCGHLVHGEPLRAAVEKTAEFVRKVTEYTCRHALPHLDGIAFEPFLHELCFPLSEEEEDYENHT